MKRVTHFFLLLVSLFLVTSCANPKSLKLESQNEKATLIEHLKHSTVALVIEKDDAFRPYCSGVWISETKILTAFHCVDDEESQPSELVGEDVLVSLYSDLEYGRITSAYHAKVINLNMSLDLALLEVKASTSKHDYVSISKAPITTGQNVHVVGHPIGFIYTYVMGTVADPGRMMPMAFGDHGKVLQISAPVWFGNSGGGVYDESGNLMGIASFIVKAPLMSFFVHRDALVFFTTNFITK